MVYRVTAELKLFNPNAMNVSDRKFSANVLKVASVVAGLTLWHLVAVYVINDSALLVSPIVVVKTTYEMLFVTGELYPHLFASSGIFFYGFVLAIIAGVPLGFVMALSPLVRGRESAEEDYKYLVQDFQPFPRDGTVSKVSFDKTMELRAKEGIYQGKKIPSAGDYVDPTLIDESLKLAGKS
jgi:hypothetical protein